MLVELKNKLPRRKKRKKINDFAELKIEKIMIKGKFLTFLLSGRKEPFSGVILAQNDEWVLIRRCVDYRLDGYTIFKKRGKKVKTIYSDYEKVANSILNKKAYNYRNDIKVPLEKLEAVLDFITQNYILLQLDTKSGDAFDVVKFIKQKDDLFIFRELTIRAKWRYRLQLSPEKIEFISFGNDYLNSLRLLI